jgi:Flp pilus assembly secretin CpaC
MRWRPRNVLAAIATAFAVFASGIEASANEIRVALDQAFPIRLADAAEGVAIGNPTIAGVSVQNDRFLFVTGRAYGTTNLVVVGSGGRVLYSGRVTVVPDETGVVMVTRAGATARMECTPLCRPRPDIGDGEAAAAVAEQISGRASAASAR